MSLSFFLAVIVVLNQLLEIDYGFWGAMLPVWVSVPHWTDNTPAMLNRMDCMAVRVLMLSIGLGVLALQFGGRQMYAFLAVPILLCYSGKRGRRKMKFFFYAFYPAHLIVPQLIHMLLYRGV